MYIERHTESEYPKRPLLQGQTLTVIIGLLCLVPLIFTPVLPLIDFYPHVARYYILANIASDPFLAENYAADWKPLPNLGLDVLGTGVMATLPPLLGAKVLAAIVILAPFLGALFLCHALHGRIGTINILLAGLLPFSLIFSWGFANFLLALGIALSALGFWIALERRPLAQLALAAVLGMLIMVVHGLVFALWGLMLAAVEIKLIQRRMPLISLSAVVRMARLAIVALLPVLFFLQTRTVSVDGGVTTSIANLALYAEQQRLWERLSQEVFDRVDSFLRVTDSGFPIADRIVGAVLWLGLVGALLRGLVRLDRRVSLAVALMVVLIPIMPPNLFGVGHLDERIPLILLSLLAAGLVPAATPSGALMASPGRWPRDILWGLFSMHLVLVSISWVREGQSYRRFLEAADQIDRGGLAQIVYAPDTQQRDIGRACKPLLSLLLLQSGAAVPTFANPSQQPLAIVGPLRQAILESSSALRQAPAPDAAGRIDAAAESGFETIVFCSLEGAPLATADTVSVARDRLWTMYRARSAL